MSEQELLQSILYMRELSASDLMDFITAFFAYTVMSHFIGASLSRSMAIGASVIYSSFAFMTFVSLFDLIYAQQRLSVQLHTQFPNSQDYVPMWSSPPEFGITLTIVPLMLGWLMSMFYLHKYIRGGKSAVT
jgi:hypothetical protein